jgi:hypothetical protein
MGQQHNATHFRQHLAEKGTVHNKQTSSLTFKGLLVGKLSPSRWWDRNNTKECSQPHHPLCRLRGSSPTCPTNKTKYESEQYFCIVLRHIYVSSPHLHFLRADDPFLLDFFVLDRSTYSPNSKLWTLKHWCVWSLVSYMLCSKSCCILARIDVALRNELLNRISDSFMGAEDVMNLKV